MKTYLVKFTVEVYEEIEADSVEDAEQAFSELWSSPAELIEEFGTYTVEELTD